MQAANMPKNMTQSSVKLGGANYSSRYIMIGKERSIAIKNMVASKLQVIVLVIRRDFRLKDQIFRTLE